MENKPGGMDTTTSTSTTTSLENDKNIKNVLVGRSNLRVRVVVRNTNSPSCRTLDGGNDRF